MSSLVIFGVGGHAREMLATVRACQRAGHLDREVLGFLVDERYASVGTQVAGLTVLGGLDWLRRPEAAGVAVVCGVGSPAARSRVVSRLGGEACCVSLVHPAAVQLESGDLAAGVYIAAGCVVATGVRLGRHVHLDSGCIVSHDVAVGELASIAPGARVAGGVRLGVGCFVGLGANVLEGRSVGDWAIVGAGSTVVDDVVPHSTVVGSPARSIAVREPGWQAAEDRNDPF